MTRRASTARAIGLAPRRAVVTALAALGLLVAQPPGAPVAAAATPPQIQRTTGIPFHQVDAATFLRLDVWRRAGANRPVVVMVHGGGWQTGSRTEWVRLGWARSFAAAGFVVVMPSYRLACEPEPEPEPERGTAVAPPREAPCGGTMAGQRHDVERAVRWTFRNARRHGGDPERVVVVGGSAGGHLALLAAVDPGIARQLDGVASISGPVDLRSIGRLGLRLDGAVAQAIRCTWQECPRRWTAHSPRFALERAPLVVPTYLYASRRDVRSSRVDAFRMAAALRARGVDVELHEPMSRVSGCHGPRSCERFWVAGTRLRLRADVMRWALRATASRRASQPTARNRKKRSIGSLSLR